MAVPCATTSVSSSCSATRIADLRKLLRDRHCDFYCGPGNQLREVRTRSQSWGGNLLRTDFSRTTKRQNSFCRACPGLRGACDPGCLKCDGLARCSPADLRAGIQRCLPFCKPTSFGELSFPMGVSNSSAALPRTLPATSACNQNGLRRNRFQVSQIGRAHV